MQGRLRSKPDGHRVPVQAVCEPAKKSFTSLAKAMGFDNPNAQAFKDFTHDLKELISLYLDDTQLFEHQNQAALDQYTRLVKSNIPWTRDYNEDWPIRYYTRTQLQIMARDFIRSQDDGQCVVTSASSRPEPDRAHIDSRSDTTSPAPALCNSAASSATRADSSDIEEKHYVLTRSDTHRKTASEGSRAVRKFLRSVWPSLETLAPTFAQAGIVSGECILALAEMPDSERNIFMRETLRLNAFQVHTLRVALKKRLGNVVTVM